MVMMQGSHHHVTRAVIANAYLFAAQTAWKANRHALTHFQNSTMQFVNHLRCRNDATASRDRGSLAQKQASAFAALPAPSYQYRIAQVHFITHELAR